MFLAFLVALLLVPAVHATERDNKTTLTLTRGQRLEVVLHSTYWRFSPLHGSSLRSDGPVRIVPRLRGCVPGEGCGTVTATYVATGVGSALVSAERTTCGEVLRCAPQNGHFWIRVIVRR